MEPVNISTFTAKEYFLELSTRVHFYYKDPYKWKKKARKLEKKEGSSRDYNFIGLCAKGCSQQLEAERGKK